MGQTATDAQLIARTPSEPGAFAAVFDRHYPAIHRYAVARLGRDEGEEVAAQTFLVALEHADRYDTSRADARPWLFGIATNLIRHQHRSRGRSARAYARLRGRVSVLAPDDEEARVDLRSEAAPVVAALEALPARERDALLLLAWAELSYEEIADALQVPVGTVRSRIHRARQALRARLALSPGGAV